MATASFDKKITIDDKAADILIREIDKSRTVQNKISQRTFSLRKELDKGSKLLKQLYSR